MPDEPTDETPNPDDGIDTAEVVMDETTPGIAAPQSPTAGAPTAGGPFAAAPPPAPPSPPPAPEPAMAQWPPANQPAEAVADVTNGSRKGRTRQLLIGALAGGLVGALVATGVFVATDDNNGSTTRVVEQPAQDDHATVRHDHRQARRRRRSSRKVEPAVVAITTDGGPDNGGAAGTGFVITSDGYIVTNNHVIEGASKISVAFNDGTTKPADLVGHDPSTDLAVLKVERDGPAAGHARRLRQGAGRRRRRRDRQRARARGRAERHPGHHLGHATARSSTDAGSPLFGMLQTDAAINPGNSGGPLVERAGPGHRDQHRDRQPGEAQNIGFAIPVSAAQPIIDDLQAGRKPAFLGVATVDRDPGRSPRSATSRSSRARWCSNVTSDSPADDAGIKNGDVIVSIDGKTVDGPSGRPDDRARAPPG